METNEITREIIRCAYMVHTELGPGLLESVYKECLAYELTESGLYVEKEKPCPLIYKSVQLNLGFRFDLLVEETVVVEVKAKAQYHDSDFPQILTYLRISGKQVGLMFNFNLRHLKDGIRRAVLDYRD